MTVDVRRAGEGDHAALAALAWHWRVEEWGGTPEMERREFEERLRAWTGGHHDTHRAFIAVVDGAAAGMAWLAVTDRVPSPARWARRAGTLQSAFVKPALRNRGVGSALVVAVLEDARRLDLDYVTVHPSERSAALYRRHGFSATGHFLELELRL